MIPTTGSTRRSFIQTAGAALSAPLAAAAVPAIAATDTAVDRDPLRARLAYLEDLEAIRALNQQYIRHVNAGTHDAAGVLFARRSDARIDPEVRGIAPDSTAEDDVIEIALDRQTATARLPRTVHAESAIGPDCPLVDMARQQGGGVVRRTERAVFETVYVRRDGIWTIASSTCRIADHEPQRPGDTE